MRMSLTTAQGNFAIHSSAAIIRLAATAMNFTANACKGATGVSRITTMKLPIMTVAAGTTTIFDNRKHKGNVPK